MHGLFLSHDGSMGLVSVYNTNQLNVGTPPKFHIDTKHDGLQYVFPFKHGYFRVSMLNLRGGGNFFQPH